ncbi:hypothetical protein CQ476_04 [TM7 phage DolZOral124_53_65]|nr:hypothetical protein CQ476_04 [TM7 phage DolZOral124_53_65]
MDITTMDEWKDRYFDQKFKNVEVSINHVLEKVRENSELTREMKKENEESSQRIAVIEAEVFHKTRKEDMPPFYRDPKVVQVILLISFIAAGVISLLLGIDITRIIL